MCMQEILLATTHVSPLNSYVMHNSTAGNFSAPCLSIASFCIVKSALLITPSGPAVLRLRVRRCVQIFAYSTFREWHPRPPRLLSWCATTVGVHCCRPYACLVALVSWTSRHLSSAEVYGATANAYVMAGLIFVLMIRSFWLVLAKEDFCFVLLSCPSRSLAWPGDGA